ncbi:alpha/beta fold hydrolase [Mesomycoplasma flocculare]|uniref:alpha/beta fold hydrolase n=1 Tax=Mesomycoplasma flocculare TaxID=2128 RepID=UPI0002D121DD|nr:alpha/beta hydrolase [Mesomycoplasma flocculare]ENX50910.1 lipase-esterase [Mesomycoplasma flocculare ATCC 27716]MXR06036.1 alpha/beta hydrolase [Mesomycoplasma flocculare]MXR12440.1 alpha/beta hydrolase [Mesomycoplasma flocculare]MXR22855.1 alpha/beta hydrolase [Mesomycoplasma flocculare]
MGNSEPEPEHFFCSKAKSKSILENWEYPFLINKSPFNKINVVFCHGFNSNHNVFWSSIEAINKELGINYYSFTLPGNNLTPATENQLYLEYYADLTVDFIKKLNLKEVILVGHSMGAANAALIYKRIPEIISKIVFIAPMNKANLPLKDLFYEKFFPKTPEEMLEFLTIYEYDKKKYKNPKYLKWAKTFFNYEYFNNKNIVDLSRNFLKNNMMDQIEEGLKQIKCPALLVLGEKDGIVLQQETKEYFEKLIGHVQTEIIPRTGHLIYSENPERFNKVFSMFLKN